MTTVEHAVNAAVSRLIEQQVEDGRQLGVQVCAYKDGERIVDTWAGTVGRSDPRPVAADSLFSSFSTTKGVAATVVLALADRGIVDYDAPVTKYWPEFGANGKDRITVNQALCHMAGVHAAPLPNTAEHVINWQMGLDYVANAEPAWEPGTATGYHAITYGWIAGGIVEKASGMSFGEALETFVTRPLGIENEMFIGIPDGVEDRLTRLQPAPVQRGQTLDIGPDHDFFKAMPLQMDINFNRLEIRKACQPAANGHFTARALARMYAALAQDGEVDGVRIVSPGFVAKATEPVTFDVDRVLMEPRGKAAGYMLGGVIDDVVGTFGPRETAFGHSGAGGSTAFADPEVGLSIAVTLNMMQNSLQGEGPTFEIAELIRGELGLD